MPALRTILKAFAALLAALVYVWAAAVRALPWVKARKAARNIGPRGRARRARG
jgi:hypothetical protein